MEMNWQKTVSLNQELCYNRHNNGIGVFALIRCAKSFDPNRGASFKTFATKAIRKENINEFHKEKKHFGHFRVKEDDKVGEDNEIQKIDVSDEVSYIISKLDSDMKVFIKDFCYNCDSSISEYSRRHNVAKSVIYGKLQKIRNLYANRN